MMTHTVTLNLLDSLYQRLKQRSQQTQRSLEDELLSVLLYKLPTATTLQATSLAYNEVVEFLDRGATAQEIADFRLSSEAQSRAKSLLLKNHDDTLNSVEEAKLDLY